MAKAKYFRLVYYYKYTSDLNFKKIIFPERFASHDELKKFASRVIIRLNHEDMTPQIEGVYK